MSKPFVRLGITLCTTVLVGCGQSPQAPVSSAPPAGGASLSASIASSTAIASARASAPAVPAAAASAPAVQTPAQPVSQQDAKNDCQSAARTTLGGGAEVLRCGFLNSADVLETVAILRRHPVHHKERDIFASRLVILRKGASGWSVALDAAQGTRNEAGYIATDFVDDNDVLWGYRVRLFNTLPDDTRKAFTLELAALRDESDRWAVGTEISWDKRVRRYREYSVDDGPGRFQPENKHPRRIPHKSHPAQKHT